MKQKEGKKEDQLISQQISPQLNSKETFYDIEQLLGVKIQNGIKYYLVKWINYDNSQNTWEPECNLIGSDLGSDNVSSNKQMIDDLEKKLKINQQKPVSPKKAVKQAKKVIEKPPKECEKYYPQLSAMKQQIKQHNNQFLKDIQKYQEKMLKTSTSITEGTNSLMNNATDIINIRYLRNFQLKRWRQIRKLVKFTGHTRSSIQGNSIMEKLIDKMDEIL